MVNESHQNPNTDTDDARMIGQIIQAAGHREAPPRADYEQVFTAAEIAWREKTASRRRRKRLSALVAGSLAAAIAIVAVLSTQTPTPSGDPGVILQKAIGTVSVRTGSSNAWRLVAGDGSDISIGSQIRTNGNSFAGLVLEDGLSLRINQNTNVAISSVRQITLASGSVYVDTGKADGASHQIEVLTPIGTARDLGTQFEVRYRDDQLRIRVREGQVFVRQDETDFESAAGEQLELDADGGVVVSRIRPDDPAWNWTQLVAPYPQINEQPLTVLLNWVARETGKRVKFEAPGIRLKVSNTILHGSVRNLPPLEALDVMLATTDMDYILLDSSVILIRLRDEDALSSGGI